mmetsp:Transcript_24878/g.38476  ORF Transcript_24878/g.38476 Transcript_24878/m.38476 type:complete len:274 (-) Transcript_24878:1566-2387(-)
MAESPPSPPLSIFCTVGASLAPTPGTVFLLSLRFSSFSPFAASSAFLFSFSVSVMSFHCFAAFFTAASFFFFSLSAFLAASLASFSALSSALFTESKARSNSTTKLVRVPKNSLLGIFSSSPKYLRDLTSCLCTSSDFSSASSIFSFASIMNLPVLVLSKYSFSSASSGRASSPSRSLHLSFASFNATPYAFVRSPFRILRSPARASICTRSASWTDLMSSLKVQSSLSFFFTIFMRYCNTVVFLSKAFASCSFKSAANVKPFASLPEPPVLM